MHHWPAASKRQRAIATTVAVLNGDLGPLRHGYAEQTRCGAAGADTATGYVLQLVRNVVSKFLMTARRRPSRTLPMTFMNMAIWMMMAVVTAMSKTIDARMTKMQVQLLRFLGFF